MSADPPAYEASLKGETTTNPGYPVGYPVDVSLFYRMRIQYAIKFEKGSSFCLQNVFTQVSFNFRKLLSSSNLAWGISI